MATMGILYLTFDCLVHLVPFENPLDLQCLKIVCKSWDHVQFGSMKTQFSVKCKFYCTLTVSELNLGLNVGC